MKKQILLIILTIISLGIMAQPLIDNLELDNSVIQVNYQKKSARLAAAMSVVLPGAGSVYVNPKRWVGYIFPILEGAMIYGYVSYRQDAKDQEKAYERYVNQETIQILDPQTQAVIYEGPRYNREFQKVVQEFISDVNPHDIYDCFSDKSGFYRLDEKNTQHFYEDVAKYDKYVFGWADWYERYAYSGSGSMNSPTNYVEPVVQWSTTASDPQHKVLGYHVVNPNYGDGTTFDPAISAMRAKYIQMRFDAEDKYSEADLFLYGMLLNRLVSAVDASLAVKRYNQDYISQSNFKINYYATAKNDRFTPMLSFTQRF